MSDRKTTRRYRLLVLWFTITDMIHHDGALAFLQEGRPARTAGRIIRSPHPIAQQPLSSIPTSFTRKELLQRQYLHQRPQSSRATSLHLSIDSSLSAAVDASSSFSSSSLIMSSSVSIFLQTMDRETAETLAGPFFGASLFPYLAFLYLLARPENDTPKGVTVGFAMCLVFVFLTIPAAIASQVLYGVSLADSDWLHGSAESLLTMTNLVTVIAFRQALQAKEKEKQRDDYSTNTMMPLSATSWAPMVWLAGGLTLLAGITALVPALTDPQVHTAYLGGFMDLPAEITMVPFGANPEPENALTIATWIIHVSSLVEFLVAMGFAWRWADVVGNPTWKGLTWGLIPLHSSGITACTYHLFYNRIPVLVPLQALLTCIGNTTAAIAAYRIARSNGWDPSSSAIRTAGEEEEQPTTSSILSKALVVADALTGSTAGDVAATKTDDISVAVAVAESESESLVGFEDLGEALAGDNDYSFLLKLFFGCAIASYAIKYGETFFDFPYDANVLLGFTVVLVPSMLNAFKWYKRSQDPTFEGWF